jgi:hypothetical protein
LQGLELLVTVLLARNRQPPPTVAARVSHAELAAELITLLSGLLEMVCEALVKLQVRLGGYPADVMRSAGVLLVVECSVRVRSGHLRYISGRVDSGTEIQYYVSILYYIGNLV